MKQRPATFDAYRLARERGVLEGTLDLAASDRLADRVAPPGERDGPAAGGVRWRIAGTADAAGRPAVAIEIDGDVPLVCQRCLERFLFPVAQRTVAVLAGSEEAADALDAETEDEVLVADHPLHAPALVEDELLLSLPYAPMHEPGACPAAAKA